MSIRNGEGKNRRRWEGKSGMIGMAVLALIAAIALPVSAANDRAVKSKVPPIYPELAKRMKISGVVKVQATVDPDGKVTAVKTLAGNSTLQTAAEDAVRKWKFVTGEGTATVDVDVTFSLSQ